MLTVGITGGIGSGKTALTDALQDMGVVIVDADAIARIIVEPGRPALAQIADHFGPQCLSPDGTLDRSALRQIVFSDPDARAWLEALTHPLIGAELKAQLDAADGPYRVLSSPLLLEGQQASMTDYVVVVDVPEAVQIKRASGRDQNSPEQIQRIMNAQLPRQERLARADYIVDNSGTMEQLREQVQVLHRHLLGLADR